MTNKAVCKTCGIEQVRVKIAQTKTMSVFVNEQGKSWKGLKYCPNCNVKRMAVEMRTLRAKRKAE